MDNNKLIDNFNTIINIFYELFPNKKNTINISNDEIINICTNFNKNISKSNTFKNYLLTNKCKLFKALKIQFIPKIKMELVLFSDNTDSNEKKNNINNIWNQLKLIYIEIEENKSYPDVEYINSLCEQLGIVSKLKDKEIVIKDNSKLDLSNFINDNKNLISNLNIGDFLNNLNNLNLDTDKEKNLLFIKNIIFEIKNKILEIKKNNSSKLDLKNILNNTNDIQDKYCKLLNNGEIKLNDIISGLFVLINNKEECDEILKEFDINDIIDSDNILDELTNMLPLEYRSIITLLKSNDSSNENFNPMDLLSSFLGNNDNKNMELTKEQLDELEEFYSKLKIE